MTFGAVLSWAKEEWQTRYQQAAFVLKFLLTADR